MFAFNIQSRRISTMKKRFPVPQMVLLTPAEHGIADILQAGDHHSLRAAQSYPPHLHNDTRLEICLVKHGRQTQVVNGRRYQLGAGDVLMILPGDKHGCISLAQEPSLIEFIVFRVPQGKSSFLNHGGLDSKSLRDALLHPASRHFALSTRGASLMDALMEALKELGQRRNAIKTMNARSLATAFLIELIQSSGSCPPGHNPPWISPIQRHILEHIDEHARVAKLAAIAGMSTSHFAFRFKKETGISPSDYALRLKIEEAKKQLALPDSRVTDVAFALGFSSSQYFTVVFRRYVFMTPTRYRKFVAQHRKPSERAIVQRYGNANTP